MLVSFSETFDQVFNYCLNIFLLCGFQTGHVSWGGRGGDFSEILVEETRRGDSMFCGSSVGGTCRGWLIFS